MRWKTEKKGAPLFPQDCDATELEARVQEMAPKHCGHRRRAHYRQLETARSTARVPSAIMESARSAAADQVPALRGQGPATSEEQRSPATRIHSRSPLGRAGTRMASEKAV